MQTEPDTAAPTKGDVTVDALREIDLDAADHIMRLAFGTFIGLPEPTAFMGDAAYVRGRWQGNPTAAFGARIDSKLVGSNFASNWGSVGSFGPLTIHPDVWDRGVGKRLMEPVMECFARWRTTHTGLFTFAQSSKHVGLYQRFGFWPRFLTAIMSKPVHPPTQSAHWTAFSESANDERKSRLDTCFELTDRIYEGLDLRGEINAVATLKLGDTLLLWDAAGLAGTAVCHCGASTEAGGGTCYIKFGAARAGSNAGQNFSRLLTACNEMAHKRGLGRLVAGVNLARHGAYRRMLEHGFHTEIQGVAMHRPNDPGYSRPDAFVIDDWR